VANGVTGVNSSDFGRGGARYAGISDSQIRGAGVVRGQVPVAPSQQSLRMADRQVNMAAMPRTRDDAHFYSRQQPAAAAGRTPFGQPGPSIQAGSRPGADRLAQNTSGQNGWRKFGEPQTRGSSSGRSTVQNVQPSRAAESPRTGSTAPARSDSGGWRRFGEPQSQGPAARPSTPVARPSYGGSHPSNPPQSAAPRTVDRGYHPDTTQRYVAPTRSSEPIRVSPPIVQQRSAPSGGGGYSAPARPSSGNAGSSAPSHSSGSSGGHSSSSHGGGRSR
jgi:hypothetical protein